MRARRSGRPRVGLLGLTLELYEEIAPDLREGREAWVREAVLPALEPLAEVFFPGAVYRRGDVEAEVADFEAAGVDALLVMLLTYSPSQMALPALQRTRLPIIVWNTQELWEVGEGFDDAAMIANHGVHGTQDLCNVLRRSGVEFEYVTSHLRDEEGTDYLADFFAAAAAVRRLSGARLGLLGYPFPGMGDFALDTTRMVATLGCEWTPLAMDDFARRCEEAPAEGVEELVAEYRNSYQVAPELTDADLAATARGELALREMVRNENLDALTYQFTAFGESDRAPGVPFVAASRLMSEGVGFGGEGDLIAAAGTAFLNWLAPPAGFTEIFTVDFAGNGVLLSHMGEANVAMARSGRKVNLSARSRSITGGDRPELVLKTVFEPGPATLCALTPDGEGGWRMVVSPMRIADFGPLEGLEVPHSKLLPEGDVRDFLTAYARAGGPHHSAVCFGDARRRLKMAAHILGADYVEV